MGSTKDYHSIKNECLRSGRVFTDPEFPPNNRSLTFDGSTPGGFRNIVWKRPREIVSNPVFIVKGATRFDLDQGYLGNCWFLSATSSLCMHQSLFKHVVPLEQEFDRNYAGVFKFNFWWYGEWREICIDDYLPTDGNRLIYCRNREQPYEFWTALLEKAYAKLRSCYQGIDGGKMQDALVDLTGGISEWVNIRDKTKLPKDLYDLMYKSFHMNSLLCAAIHGQGTREQRMANGLYTMHAYSITGLATVPRNVYEVKLIRLRNPHGKGEWNGPWSDNSPEMISSPRDIKGKLDFMNLNDGEFWMSYDDWLQNFDEVAFCHLTPDNFTQELALSRQKYQWNVTVYHDSWINGVTAGGCGNTPYNAEYWTNPQFFVTLKQPDGLSTHGQCTLITSLMEKEQDNRKKIAIGFQVYRLKDQTMNPAVGTTLPGSAMHDVGNSGVYNYVRECTCRMDLPPGTYVVIPTTFKYNDPTSFMIRFFTEKQFESGVLDVKPNPNSPGIIPTPAPTIPSGPSRPPPAPQPSEPDRHSDAITEIYMKYARANQKLDPRELRSFLNELVPALSGDEVRFNIEAARSLHVLYDKDRDGYITLEESKTVIKEVQAYIRIFKQFDVDDSGFVESNELGSMFEKLDFGISTNVFNAIRRRYGGRNGRITMEDFVIIVAKLLVMFYVFRDHRINRSSDDSPAQFTLNEFLEYTMFL